MATSPNYGWSEPDNSSLVKNGAADIRTLGDAIDTSVWNVGFGQAAKNKLLNADFAINQRAFTSTTTTDTYGFDRWRLAASDGTVTYSAQTFTLGAAPVAGYEGKNFARVVTTGQTLNTAQGALVQRIESVRTFAGQTVTISFWAKAATGSPKVAVDIRQRFGSGGSPSTNVSTVAGQVTLSTSWTRYSLTAAIPSISGKTLGTAGDDALEINLWYSAGSTLDARTNSLGIQSNTFDIWGVQAEYGSKATPFQTASGGSPQQELAMCQRYYWRFNGGQDATILNYAFAGTSTFGQAQVQFPVPMRVAPTSLDYNTVRFQNYAGSTYNLTSLLFNQQVATGCQIYGTISGATAGHVGSFTGQGAGSYVGMSAEL